MAFNRILLTALHILAGCLYLTLAAQPATSVYTEALRAYKRGLMFYDLDVHDLARREMETALALLGPSNEPAYEQLRVDCALIMAKAAAKTKLPESEMRTLNFIREQVPDPAAGQAVVEMANYYFNAGEFDQALTYYKLADRSGMSGTQKSEVQFKIGYAHFVKKEFAAAKSAFRAVAESKHTSEYQQHAHYYLGNIYLSENKLEDAVRSFQKVSESPRYRDVIPYNLLQIYAAQKNYNKVISYGQEALRVPNVRNREEINRLIGQAYFEKGDYVEAVKFLEPASRAGKMSESDFYQLGYAQFATKQYRNAIPNLEQLNKTDNKMGQLAMYTLADCHLKLGNRQAARNAFAVAGRMDYDREVKDVSLLTHAKLSYEIGLDREAINSLQQISGNSAYYQEARLLMGRALLNTKDYGQALSILESIPNKGPDLQEVMQKVLLYRGLQLYREGNTTQAASLITRSLEYNYDAATRAEAIYWQGEMAYNNGDYNRAIDLMKQFLSLYRPAAGRAEVSPYTAQYIIGYSHLKKKDYNAALTAFTECVNSISRDRSRINSTYVTNQVLPDATLRAGDCHFKRNKYDEALKYYDEAVSKKYPDFEYALYQKAVILGLRKKVNESLVAFEKLARDYPNSDYADDALFQAGTTYMNISQFDKAAAPFQKLLDNYKGKSEYYNATLLQMGLLSYNQGNTTRAIGFYKEIFKNNPDPSEAKLALSALEDIYINDLGKPEEYASFLETVPGYKVDNIGRDSLNFKAAQTQFENGNYERAIEGFTTYLQKYPNGGYVIQALYNRGESYAALKKYSPALKDYEAVVNKGNNRFYQRALYKAALIAYNHEQNFKKSFDLYVLLEKNAPDDNTRFEAQLGAMRSAYRSGNKTATAEYARKVADNPKATREQQAAANFFIGKIAFDDNNFTTAISSLLKVLPLTGGEQAAEARYYIAAAYFKQNKFNEAMKYSDELIDKHGDYPYWIAKGIILQSDVFVAQKDYFNARAALEAVIENFDQDAAVLQEAKDKLKALEALEKSSSRLLQPGE